MPDIRLQAPSPTRILDGMGLANVTATRIRKNGPENHVIVAGAGRMGSSVAEVLRQLGLPFVLVELDLARFKGRVPVELMGRTPFPPIGDLPYLLTLPAHASISSTTLGIGR